jgi:hypothetical protein
MRPDSRPTHRRTRVNVEESVVPSGPRTDLGHIGERTILVERAVALGQLKTTKTGRTRTVRLLAPLAADLREWRINRGRPWDDTLVFPARGGDVWGDDAWRYWRRRILRRPSAPSASTRRCVRTTWATPSCPSCLPRARTWSRSRARGATSPTMTLSTYAHLFDEAAAAERVPTEDQIRRARQLVRGERRTRFVPEDRSKPSAASDEEPANPEEPTPGLEPGTPSLRVKCSTS